MNKKIIFAALLGGIFAIAGSAAPKHGKLAPDFKTASAGETVDVIIQYNEEVTEEHIRTLQQRHRGRHKQTFQHLNTAQAWLPAAELERLAEDPSVLRITPNRAIEGSLDHATAVANYLPLDNYLVSLGKTKGGGVGIVFLDSGITQQYNFDGYLTPSVNRVVAAESMIDSDPVDRYGHGTHVAGIAAGMDNVTASIAGAKRGFWGIAPDARIISLKVLNSLGVGSDAAVIAGVNRAIALKTLHPEWNIRVMNLSLGRPVFESYKLDPICQAVEKAWKAGIFVVVAAGNEGRNNLLGNNGYGTITSPGNDPLVITVGAVNAKNSYDRNAAGLTSYSSKGPTLVDHIVKPDIVAPGNRVTSYLAAGATLPTTFPANVLKKSDYDPAGSTTAPGPYITLSGTSMAAPLVSGLAAVAFQYYPTLTPDQTKAFFMKNAWRGLPAQYNAVDPTSGVTYKVYGDVFTIGAGLLDCWQTAQDLGVINLATLPTAVGSAASPTAFYDSVSKSVKVNLNSTGAASVIWGTSVTWGTSVIWGTNVSGNSLIWGTSVIWGTSSASAFSVIWGTTSPWALSLPPTGEASVIAINGEN